MAEWQKEIRNLAKDFCVPKAVYRGIIANVKEKYNGNVPVDYKGNENKFLYNMAHKELKQYLFKVLV